MTNEAAFKVRVKGEPFPLQRPRLGRHGNVYTPKESMDHKTTIGWCVKNAMGPKPACRGEVGLSLFFACLKDRKDVDNLAKLVMDALTGVAYKDDTQVSLLIARRVKVDRDPYTLIEMWEV